MYRVKSGFTQGQATDPNDSKMVTNITITILQFLALHRPKDVLYECITLDALRKR